MQGSSGTREVRLLSVPSALWAVSVGDLRARSPDGGHTCLYVLVVRYIYDSSVQALDSPGAATRAPSRRRPSLTTHAVGSKFAFERPVGGSLLDSSRMRRLLVSYRPLACALPGGKSAPAALRNRVTSDWLIAELTRHQAHGATKQIAFSHGFLNLLAPSQRNLAQALVARLGLKRASASNNV